MSNQTLQTATGKIVGLEGNVARFVPSGTNYELHLEISGKADAAPLNVPVNATIRVDARKIYTVPSGGNWIEPIAGRPRTIQGRVREVSNGSLVVHAGGAGFMVHLPQSEAAIDLNHGPIRVGSMVNVVALPGATMEIEG